MISLIEKDTLFIYSFLKKGNLRTQFIILVFCIESTKNIQRHFIIRHFYAIFCYPLLRGYILSSLFYFKQAWIHGLQSSGFWERRSQDLLRQLSIIIIVTVSIKMMYNNDLLSWTYKTNQNNWLCKLPKIQLNFKIKREIFQLFYKIWFELNFFEKKSIYLYIFFVAVDMEF